MFKIRFFRFPTSLLHNNQYLNPESIVFFVRCLAVQIFIFEKQKFYVCVYAKYIKDDAVIYESQLKQVIGIKLQILQTIRWGLSIVNVRKKTQQLLYWGGMIWSLIKMRAKKGEIVCIRAAGQLVGDTLLRSLCVFWDNFPGLRRQLWDAADTTKLPQGERKGGKEEFYRSDKKGFYPKEVGVHGWGTFLRWDSFKKRLHIN